MPKTDDSSQSRFLTDAFGAVLPVRLSSMGMKPLAALSGVLRRFATSFSPVTKAEQTEQSEQTISRHDLGTLESEVTQCIDGLEQAPYGHLPGSSSAMQIMGHVGIAGSEAGQEGCNPVDEGSDEKLSESPKTGGAAEGDKTMANSAMENDPNYKFGVLDTKVDRLQEDMTKLTNVVTEGFTNLTSKFDNHITSQTQKKEDETTARRDSWWNLRNGIVVAVIGGIVGGIIGGLATAYFTGVFSGAG